MSRRIDYYDDPNAPKANSLVPSVNVVVTNDNGEILLIRRSDNDNWAIPGGAIDLGESLTEAAIRETREETGITCEITGLVGIYTDPKHVILYTSNGEARQEFSIVLTATAIGGIPVPSSESSEVRWTPRDEVSSLQMDRSMTMRITHYLAGHSPPHLGLLAERVRYFLALSRAASPARRAWLSAGRAGSLPHLQRIRPSHSLGPTP